MLTALAPPTWRASGRGVCNFFSIGRPVPELPARAADWAVCSLRTSVSGCRSRRRVVIAHSMESVSSLSRGDIDG
jgi:hypothetical protein